MSTSCNAELLKAHAVIARSWLKAEPLPQGDGQVNNDAEIQRWYGRESHPDFEVCADDHCQRYQGITKALSDSASRAVSATQGQFLKYDGVICDARFSKSCGGMMERFSTAWQDIDVPYLKPLFDGPAQGRSYDPEQIIRSGVPAYCNTQDRQLLSQ